MTSTSINQQFRPFVDEFIDDLKTFATGSYLNKDEKEFWEQPFDPAVLPQLRQIIDGFLSDLDRLPETAEHEVVTEVVDRFVTAAEAFNDRHAGAVIEPEEFDELNSLISQAVAAAGFVAPDSPDTSDAEDGTALPRFD